MTVEPALAGLQRRAPDEQAPASSEAILVVDGDESIRDVIVSAIERLNRAVVQVETGEQALEAAERDRPAAVITEVLLPTISGYELCRALKDRYGSSVPVIFVSALRTHPADRVAGLLLGADDYLAQPVQADELLVRVRRLLKSSEQGAVARAGLTLREEEVLQLMTEGLHHGEIAERLGIAPRTVAKHVEHVLHKLRVHTRAQAVAVALRDQPRL